MSISKYNKLTDKEAYVMLKKGTESPFSGKYINHDAEGVYSCKQCNAKLFLSEHKFNSSCGWPAFDNAIQGALKVVADHNRSEIICANCNAHLGHVFLNEGFTALNTRHCVNSICLNFSEEN